MKQKRQLAVLVVLLLVAGVIWFFYFNHDKPMVTAEAGSPVQNYQLLSVDNPQLHNDGVDKARKTEYKSRGRNIFSRELPPPPPPKHPVQDPKTPIVPLPPPPPSFAALPTSTSREHLHPHERASHSNGREARRAWICFACDHFPRHRFAHFHDGGRAEYPDRGPA